MGNTRASKRRSRSEKEEEKADGKKLKSVSVDDNLKNKSPVVVFAHGAGAPSSSAWMIRYIAVFCVYVCVCFVVNIKLTCLCRIEINV